MEGKILRFRHNVMQVSSIDTFVNLRGCCRQGCRDVYFVRAVGVSPTLVQDVKRMDETLCRYMREKRLWYTRVKSLPKLVHSDEIARYSDCYYKWVETGRQKMQSGISVQNPQFWEVLGRACAQTVTKYRAGSVQPGSSIEKNLVVKMIFWMDTILKDGLQGWTEQSSVKIVAENIAQPQEYLFFYLLTLLGVDVLLLQTEKDIAPEAALQELSEKIVLGAPGVCSLPAFSPEQSAGQPQAPSGGAGIRIIIPERNQNRRQRDIPQRVPPQVSGQNVHRRMPQTEEKSFEELAMLASSIVMITLHGDNKEVLGSGSGIMIGRQGYILTNHHVAGGGRYYSVRIEDDDRVYESNELIKYNPLLDLAVIRIDQELSPLPIYQGGRKLVRGQKVVAIGSPRGLFNSVSDGIISGFRTTENQVEMIQFTAPISPGSSGGAVLNMQGEVIGISTAGIDQGQNLNFAMGYECINNFIQGFV